MTGNGGGRAAAALLLLAILVRGALLLALGPAAPLENDEREYAAVAGRLARGEGFAFTAAGVSTEGEPFVRTLRAFRAPLLPLVLAPVHGLTGGSTEALRWACVLLGALAAPIALAAGARAGGARAGWIAGAAVALWPSHAWLSTRVLSEPLDAALLLAAADLLLRRRAALAGAALGLALLCRPGGLPAAVLLAGVGGVLAEPGRRLRAAAVVAAAAAAVVLPWVARNLAVLGSPVLVTTSGLTLLGGNCDASLEADVPGKWVPPDRAWRGPGGPDLLWYGWSDLDEAASSARFAARARAWVAEHPGRAARLAFWKGVRFLDPDTRSEKPDARRKSLAGWLSWGPALAVLVLAFAAGAARRPPAWWAGAALLLGHLAASVATYGDARVRAPAVPALLALVAAPWLADRLANRGDRSIVEP